MMHHETSSSTQNYERHLEAAFNLMNKYGYDAVKTGYVGDIIPRGDHHFSQSTNNHYMHVIEEAAKHHIYGECARGCFVQQDYVVHTLYDR